MSRRSSQRISWKQREKFASTQLSTYSSPSGATVLRGAGADRPAACRRRGNRSMTMNSIHPRASRGGLMPSARGACPSACCRLGSKQAHSGADFVQMVGDGFGEARIVQRPHAHDDLMRARLGLAEEGRAALGAEAPVHGRAAVRAAHMIGQRARDGHRFLEENRVDRSASRAEILADAAPAMAHAERRVRRRS